MRGRIAVSVALAGLMLPALAGRAAAGPLPGASTDNDTPTATVVSTTTVPGAPGGGAGTGGGGLRCTYAELRMAGPTTQLAYRDEGGEAGVYGTSASGRWATRTCFNGLGQEVSSTVVPLASGGRGATPVDPQVLLEDALARLQIPDPVMAANPPLGSASLVRVPAWLWLDGGYWQARSATASAGGASATVTAEPVSARWSMGDGAVVACDGPGRPWSAAAPMAESPCSHTYLTSSSAQPGDAYPVTVTVTWSVSWTSTVPGVGGDLEDQTRSASVQVAVAEVQALGQ